MHSIASAVVKSGLLTPEVLAEFKRWGFSITEPVPVEEPFARPEDVVQAIESALQSEDLIITRSTDLEAANNFLRTAQTGQLHVVCAVEGEPDTSAEIECLFGRTLLGDYILQWHAESIEEFLTNGKTFLIDDARACAVFFARVQEVFFGKTKAFLICTPRREPHDHGG